jgi:hypothetical protein
MCKKLFSAFLLIVFSFAVANAGGVTNIKEVINRSAKVVKLSTYENKNRLENGWKTTGEIAAGANWKGDMWIPWADTKEQFAIHFMKIEIIEQRPAERTDSIQIFAAYQSGEYVRSNYDRTVQSRGDTNMWYLSQRSYNADAPKVDGEWKSGGDRRVIFYDKPDGSVGFKFEKL